MPEDSNPVGTASFAAELGERPRPPRGKEPARAPRLPASGGSSRCTAEGGFGTSPVPAPVCTRSRGGAPTKNTCGGNFCQPFPALRAGGGWSQGCTQCVSGEGALHTPSRASDASILPASELPSRKGTSGRGCMNPRGWGDTHRCRGGLVPSLQGSPNAARLGEETKPLPSLRLCSPRAWGMGTCARPPAPPGGLPRQEAAAQFPEGSGSGRGGGETRAPAVATASALGGPSPHAATWRPGRGAGGGGAAWPPRAPSLICGGRSGRGAASWALASGDRHTHTQSLAPPPAPPLPLSCLCEMPPEPPPPEERLARKAWQAGSGGRGGLQPG